MKKNDKYVPDIGSVKKMLMIMKATVLLICVFTLQSYASSLAQSTKISMSMKNTTFKDVIEYIEEQTDYYFMLKYDEGIVSKKVDVDFKNAPIADVLDELLEGTGYSYKLIDRYIAINRINSENSVQQQEEVKGKVTDENGGLLPGVSIIIKGTTIGTVSDFDGKFTLAAKQGDIIQFSFIGMKTQEVVIGTQTTFDIVMEADAIGLEEVIAIGYGVARKSDLTGAVTKVDVEGLAELPNVSVMQSLKGAVPGLNVSAVDGVGQDPSLLIRGKIHCQVVQLLMRLLLSSMVLSIVEVWLT